MDQNVNVSGETLKLLQYKERKAQRDTSIIRSPNSQDIRPTIDKLDFGKPKSFCTANEPGNGMRFQFKEWEDNFADCLSDKGLIAKLYKELKKLSNKKSNNTISNCRK